MNTMAVPKLPKVYTLFIYSKKRVQGADSSDYYVNLPIINAMSSSEFQPQFYDLFLDRICGTQIVGAADNDITTVSTSFVQICFDFTAPNRVSNAGKNVLFIVPVLSAGNAYMMDSNSSTINPVVVSSSSLQNMLHISVFDDRDRAIVPGDHEHIMVLTLKERL